jgi:hypothetical protein
MVPIVQVGKLRLRETEEISQGHPAGRQHNKARSVLQSQHTELLLPYVNSLTHSKKKKKSTYLK